MTQGQLDNVVTAINNRAKTTDVSSGLATKVDKVTSTDNAIARFDGTTGALQNSGVTISDDNVVTASGFSGPLTGNASTATKLVNARTIGITGDITWTSPSFDGSGNITAAATLAASGVTAGTYTKVTVDSKGRTTSGTTLSATDIPALDVSKITTGTLSVARGGTGVTTSTGTGSVVFSTSPVLTTPNIGVATGTSFNSITGLSSTTPANNGTAAIGTSTTVARADHVHASDSTKVTANADITAGTATKITYDAKGLVTAGTQMSLEDIPDSTFKKSVRCATTENLAATYANNVLTLSSVGVTIIDGITIALNDRVLIKDQTTTLQNGIYTVTTLGTASVATVFTRSLDADVITELASSLVAVGSGTVNGGRLFDNDLKTTDTLGTTTVTFNLVVDTGFASTVVGSTPGTAAIGTSTSYARADHVHPVQTTITGNAATATTLQTARTISGVSFNGSANIDIEDRLGTAIASAATTTVGTRGLGDYIHITGTTTITSLGTATAAGVRRTLIFDEVLTLTHNATSLVCPGAANIVTVAGTVIEVIAETTANWRVVSVTHPSLSMAELGYLDGVTSSIQTQLNGKAPLASPALTGTPTAPTAASGVSTTQLATTQFVNTTNIGNGTTSFNGFGGIGFKNYIINGGFDVWQRGTYWTGLTNGTYSADRWVVYGSVGDESYNVIRHAGIFNGGYGAEFTFTAGSGAKSIIQFIENITRFKIGSKITLSFDAFASQNVDIQPIIQGVRGPWTISTAEAIGDINIINLTTTKTRYSVTFTVPDWTGVVNGGWGTLHDTKLAVKLNLATGVGIGTSIAIGNVQLEEGSVATPFEQRPYGLELSLCQRYYETGGFFAPGYNVTASSIGGIYAFKQRKRVAPSMTTSTSAQSNCGNLGYTFVAEDCVGLFASVTTTGSAQVTGNYTASAEL